MSMKAVYVLTKMVGKSIFDQCIVQEVFTERSGAVRSMTNFRNLQNPQLKDEYVDEMSSEAYGYSCNRSNTVDGEYEPNGYEYRAVIAERSVDEYDLQDYEQDFMVELELKQVYNFTVKVREANERVAKELAI